MRTPIRVRRREERVIGGVPCRVFLPDGTPSAVYLHFHGGGMISGSAALMDIPNQMLAKKQRVAVVSVEYRQAPEFPWPDGPDDGVAVARALIDGVAAELGSERLLIGGESAGGYMAAAVALRVRDELHAIDRVDGLNLTYGMYDWSGSPSQLGVRAVRRLRHSQPGVLLPRPRLLRARTNHRGAASAGGLAGLRGPARVAAVLRQRGHGRSPVRRFVAVRDASVRRRCRRRARRVAGYASRLPDLRLCDDAGVVRGAVGVVREPDRLNGPLGAWNERPPNARSLPLPAL